MNLALGAVFLAMMVAPAKPRAEAAGTWSSWNRARSYPGLHWKRRRGSFSKYAGKYIWDVKFKNQYAKTIHFSFVFTESWDRTRPQAFSYRMTLRPQQERETNTWKKSKDGIRLWVGNVRLGSSDLGPDVRPKR